MVSLVIKYMDKRNSTPCNIMYEVIPIRLFLIVNLVFYHAFAIFSGSWDAINGYPDIHTYNILDKLSYSVLLEAFVFISGCVFGFQVRVKGEDKVLSAHNVFLNKFKRLLIPSILFSSLYVICFGVNENSFVDIVYKILSRVGHMWFLPMLFWCFVLTYFIEKTRFKEKVVFPILTIAICCCVIPLPFGLNTALYYLFFFYSGYYLQKNNIKIVRRTDLLLIVSIFLFIITFVIKIHIADVIQICIGGYSV